MNTHLAIALCFVTLLCAGSRALAEGEKGAVGIVLGAPTGVSGKVFLRPAHALDFDLAWDFVRPGATLTGDYLFHFREVYKDAVVEIAPYVGPGAAVSVFRRHGVGAAVRATGGVDVLFQEIPLELFVDLSPGVWLAPATRFYGGGVLGIRFLFR